MTRLSLERKGVQFLMLSSSRTRFRRTKLHLNNGSVSSTQFFDTFLALEKQPEPHLSDPTIFAVKACMNALVTLGHEFIKIRPKLVERLESRRGFICPHVARALWVLADDVNHGEGSEELLNYIWSSLSYLMDTGANLGLSRILGGRHTFEVATRI